MSLILFLQYPDKINLLDEIDAALDEQNVSRFVQVLKEFGSSSQFIVITHNKKTVTGAQTLLGVTMEESGISKVISVRLENTGHIGSSTTSNVASSEDLENVDDEEPPQQELWGENFKEEEVEREEGRQLPPGVNDPAKVSDSELRPIRAGKHTKPE